MIVKATTRRVPDTYARSPRGRSSSWPNSSASRRQPFFREIPVAAPGNGHSGDDRLSLGLGGPGFEPATSRYIARTRSQRSIRTVRFKLERKLEMTRIAAPDRSHFFQVTTGAAAA